MIGNGNTAGSAAVPAFRYTFISPLVKIALVNLGAGISAAHAIVSPAVVVTASYSTSNQAEYTTLAVPVSPLGHCVPIGPRGPAGPAGP